jgi:hypothetical protein
MKTTESFRELFEGMNQRKQNGMMSKNKFEKYLDANGFMQIGSDEDGTTLELRSDKKWYLDGSISTFTKLYQIYRTAFKNGEINESKMDIYGINAIGNFYGGKYYEQGMDTFFVLASSPKEAKEISSKNIDTITNMFKNKKYSNGKYAISKKDNVPVKIGISEPKPVGRTGGKKILTKSGKFEEVSLKDYKD